MKHKPLNIAESRRAYLIACVLLLFTGVSISSARVRHSAATLYQGFVGGVYLTTPPTLTNGQTSGLLLNSSGSLKMDGSAVTQPVSAASLPLPTGASTSAKQPALGTAGTASADVITVQGITSMTAIKVDGSGVTQPVSGTVTANQGTSPWIVAGGGTAGTAASGVVSVQGIASMTPVYNSDGGNSVSAVAANAGTTVIKASAGRLAKVLVTATGTGVTTFYDNASAASGTIIGIIPNNAAVGSVWTFGLPSAAGITLGGSSTPAVTVSYW